ncbi:MAG: polysaccharide pyruvyl transferase family protein [Anaerolineales bacterium]|nr:polysaccharide pyruvyl transferase family protein [Anaerolineales bacterium]
MALDKIVLLSPDSHILYDGSTPGEKGVGGGVTVRVRMAAALARLGKAVTLSVNCPREETFEGVRYIPYTPGYIPEADVLIIHTSGGEYSLDGLDLSSHGGALSIYWMTGTEPPAGFDPELFTYVYAPSNFLRKQAVETWGVNPEQIFVVYNGFEERYFSAADSEQIERDPFRLVYFSHPSKGLQPAIQVLRQLRKQDERFNLHIFGGSGLWGESNAETYNEPGIVFHGLIGQRELVRGLFRASFSICLQDRQEPFGMVVTESQRAGCIVLASTVGAYPELIDRNTNGFLVPGQADSSNVITASADLILTLQQDPVRLAEIRRAGQSVPWNSDLLARCWVGHWDYWSGNRDKQLSTGGFMCSMCGGQELILEDGKHCLSCGNFTRNGESEPGISGAPARLREQRESRAAESKYVPHILIAGYYGFGNLGDEAILSSMISDLQQKIPDVVFTVLSGNPLRTEQQHSVKAVFWSDEAGIRSTISESDLVLLGGGGLFHDYLNVNPDGFFTYRHLSYESLVSVAIEAKLSGKLLMLFGVGVGPFFSALGKACLELIVQLSDAATARDEESFQLIVQGQQDWLIPAELSADPGFLMDSGVQEIELPFLHNDLEGPFIIVVPRLWQFTLDENHWQQILINVLDRFAEETEAHVLLVPFQEQPGDAAADRGLCENLCKHMRHSGKCSISEPFQNLHDAVALIGSADLVLSMRFHGLIFSAIAGTPMVSLAYDPKNTRLMDTLGLKEFDHPLSSLDEDRLLESLLQCWEDREAIHEKLTSAAAEMRKSAKLSAEKAAQLLKHQPGKRSLSVRTILKDLAAFEEKHLTPGETRRLDEQQIELLIGRYEQFTNADQKLISSGTIEPSFAAALNPEHIKTLYKILQANEQAKGVILYPPIIDWGFMFQRPQQLARALAEEGYLLFYCTPNSLSREVDGFKELESGLYLTDVPFRLFSMVPDLVLLLGSALHRPLLDQFPGALILYDYYDDLSVSGMALVDHQVLVEKADLIFVSSKGLLETLPFSEKNIYLPNAANPASWERKPDDALPDWSVLDLQGKAVVGYAGALAEWLDYELLLEVVKKCDDLDFVLIGVDYDGSLSQSGLLDQINVFWLGMLPHDEMQSYVKYFDIGLIPFQINQVTLATSPVKLYEYMAAGIPVVSTPIPECSKFTGVYLANDGETFAEKIRTALVEGKEHHVQKALQEQAQGNTWKARARVVDTAIVSVRQVSERLAQSSSMHSNAKSEPVDLPQQAFIKLLDLRLKALDWQANIRRLEDLTDQHLNKMAEQQHTINKISQMQEKAQQENNNLRGVIEERNRKIQTLENDLEDVRLQVERLQSANAKQADQLEYISRETAALQTVIAESRQELADSEKERRQTVEHRDKLADELFDIHRSRYWQLLGVYWRLRERVSRLWYGIRHPSIRRRIRDILARKRSHPSQRSSEQTEKPSAESCPRLEVRMQPDVIVLPIIDWEFRFQRPQQIARQFARNGQRVFYARTTFHQDDSSVEEIDPNTYQFSLHGRSSLNLYRDAMSADDADTMLHGLEALAAEWSIKEAVCLIQLPFWKPLAEKLRTRFGWLLVYDCMDDHGGFSTNTPAMLAQEEELLAECDLALATSRVLLERCETLAPETLLLPNAVDFDHFAPEKEIPRPLDMPDTEGPVIGYVGAISDWFDFGLLAPAVEAHPDWTFVLIGSTWGAEGYRQLERCPNFHFLGEKPYDEVPGYLNCFDCCVIPFKDNRLTRATNPVKLYEYLAAGKPVVARRLPELEAFGDSIHLAENGDQFLQELELALRENSPESAAGRTEAVRDHSWHARFERLQIKINRLFGRTSVIIVAWNNVDLTRQCLDSLLRSTSHPDLEFIVVDNASEDGTQAVLQEYAEADQRFHLILNETNRGFGPALNQGFEAASGDFIAVLNNDVVLTPGWLSVLTARLRQDPSIGMVGPVSNGAWNEALVEGSYSTDEEMLSFAWKQASRYCGLTAPIRMLAMYCVLIPQQVLKIVGLMDENYRVGMFEDDDYALRMKRAGYRMAVALDVFVHHDSKSSFKLISQQKYKHIFSQNRKYFEDKWKIHWQAHISTDLVPVSNQYRELEELVSRSFRGSDVVLVASVSTAAELQFKRSRKIAEALADQGAVIFLLCSDRTEEGIEQLLENLYLTSAAAPLWDCIYSPVVIAESSQRSTVLTLRSPRVIYDVCVPEDNTVETLFESREHQAFMKKAEAVLVRSPEILSLLEGEHGEVLFIPAAPEESLSPILKARATRDLNKLCSLIQSWKQVG